MTLFDVLTVKAKKLIEDYLYQLHDDETDYDAKDEFDNWWDKFVSEEFSWIDEKKLTDKNLIELREVNQDYADHFIEVDINVSITEMLWRYKKWTCDPDDWDNYFMLKEMFEEQWDSRFPEYSPLVKA